MDLKDQARAILAQKEAKVTESGVAWKAFSDARAAAIKENVDFGSNTAAFDKLDELGKSYDAARDAVNDLDVKYQRVLEMAGEGEGVHAPAMKSAADVLGVGSIGDRLVKSGTYADLKASGSLDSSARFGSTKSVELTSAVELKTLLSLGGTTAAGAIVQPERRDGIIPIALAPLTMLDLVTVSTTTRDVIEWVREKTRTNAAAETAEGLAAPQSTLDFEIVSESCREIKHIMNVTKTIMADAPRLVTWVDVFLIDGVKRRLHNQLVSGLGTGQDLRGLYSIIGILTQAKGVDTVLDAVHKAITKIRVQNQGAYEPKVVGIHPTDMEAILLAKDTQGRYLMGGPQASQDVTVWGLKPIVHPVFPVGKPMVCDPSMAELVIRLGVSSSFSDSNQDYFEKGIITLLGTMRAAFGTNFPTAFCEVDTTV